MATVAYGTSRRTDANKGLELHVRKPADLAVAGLHRKTRFVGARTTTVALSCVRFVPCHSGTPVLGYLAEHLHCRLKQVAPHSGALKSETRQPRR
jgi:hypothetical protein